MKSSGNENDPQGQRLNMDGGHSRTDLQCLWTPATVSMMEHSPSFRQKARSLSSTHGLKTSERGLGGVGATAEDENKGETLSYSWRQMEKKKNKLIEILHLKSQRSRGECSIHLLVFGVVASSTVIYFSLLIWPLPLDWEKRLLFPCSPLNSFIH